jgi:plastocyanin
MLRSNLLLLLALICLLTPLSGVCTTFNVNISGNTFTPNDISICPGDVINFQTGPSNNAVEVSQATYNANGNTPLAGGFSVPLGGGTVNFPTIGVYYYVSIPNASLGMKGIIRVVAKPVFSQSPQTQTVCAGTNVNLFVTTTGATSYVWRRGTTTVQSGPSSTLSLTNVTATQAGSYTVIASNGNCSTTSGAGVLTITPKTAITTQPTTQTQCYGGTVTITFAATGTAPINYGLRRGSTTIQTNTSPSFTINNFSTADTGLYNVIVTSGCGPAATSPNFRLIGTQPPTLGPAIPDRLVCAGERLVFRTSATGSGIINFVWARGSSTLLGTFDSLVINSASPADAGAYSVVSLNSCGLSQVDTFVVSVNVAPSSVRFDTLCAGDSLVLLGNPFKQTGVYILGYPYPGPCDSIVTLRLTVHPAYNVVLPLLLCSRDSVLFKGLWRRLPGTYRDTLRTAFGCDSVLSLILDTLPQVATSITRNICSQDSFFFDGSWRRTSGRYIVRTPSTTGGCDTLNILDLSVTTINVTVNIAGPLLVASGNADNIQWQRDGISLIDSTGPSIFPSVPGFYSVIGTTGLCYGVSNLVQVSATAREDEEPNLAVRVYPNPTQDELTVQFPFSAEEQQLWLYDRQGTLVLTRNLASASTQVRLYLAHLSEGIYKLITKTGKRYKTFSVLLLN